MGYSKNRVIPDGANVASETVALIYFLEGHPRDFDTARALFQRVESAEITGAISNLVFAEFLVPAYGVGDHTRTGSLIRKRALRAVPWETGKALNSVACLATVGKDVGAG